MKNNNKISQTKFLSKYICRSNFNNMDSFINRHIGPDKKQVQEMCDVIGIADIDELIDKTIPSKIRLKKALRLPPPLSEFEYSAHIRDIAGKNKLWKTYIGMGYYGTITPAVIQKNIFENPGWYTSYTPYQAEISQGRLEGMLNFQTMITDLTGFEISNASLLDEGTAAAEAMMMIYHAKYKGPVHDESKRFFVSETLFPQTLSVLKTRSKYHGIELIIGDHTTIDFDKSFFGAIVQYPAWNGDIHDYTIFTQKVHDAGAFLIAAADILSLSLLKPPAEWGADVAIGSTQRFGIPLGYGGPHAAYFACKADFKRRIPGRIIGVSQDKHGNPAFRLSLQTREQHIRREKATSNICTAQALLAVMAGMYAVYHGPEVIADIATKIHLMACSLNKVIQKLGYEQQNNQFFDTLSYNLPSGVTINSFKKTAEKHRINLNYHHDYITLSIDETTSRQDIEGIIKVFAHAIGKQTVKLSECNQITIQKSNLRNSTYLQHPVFKLYRTENEMMRYLKRLENKDISLTHSMISLGSCTMKMNAATGLFPLSLPEFANLHPFVPQDQALGYKQIIEELSEFLCEITGFDAVSFQPNSGAQGEFSGLLVIRAYHDSRRDKHRNVVLIPASAHGTNPASAVLAGMNVVVIKCDQNGNIDIKDLEAKAIENKDNLAALMVTYPSTHGVFEEQILEITNIIHNYGGLVYMDGANMNAQVGLTNPATIGADVCHLNLHKTFAIPHGGGGPGVGPIAVSKKLSPFLPSHSILEAGEMNIDAVSSAPYGSALILLISYGYIRMLSSHGLTEATKTAILNANYISARLDKDFPVLYKGNNGYIAHEMILDCREFKKSINIEVEDISKRLMDYGFHAPTVSFPVHGTLMVEPTESEAKCELDRFCDAMLSIKKEIKFIEKDKSMSDDNVIINAPHTSVEVSSDKWGHNYSRQDAAYPLPYLFQNKYWPPVGKIDNALGDRNLICTCISIDLYEKICDEI